MDTRSGDRRRITDIGKIQAETGMMLAESDLVHARSLEAILPVPL